MAQSTNRLTLTRDAARGLGCWVQATVDTNYGVSPGTTLSLGNMANYTFDDQKFQFAYVRRADGKWRLITSTTIISNGDVTLASAFPDGTGLQANDTVDIFMVLDPDNWTWCVQEGIKDEYRKVSVMIPLEEAVSSGEGLEYDLSAAASWLQHRGQIIRMRYRNSETRLEEDISVIYVVENDYSLTLKIPQKPAQFDQIRIEAKRYYESLDADTDEVTLPSALAKARIRKTALEQIFQTLGPGAKQYWGQAMVLAERNLYTQEARWKQNEAEYRDYTVEDEPYFQDPAAYHEWGW